MNNEIIITHDKIALIGQLMSRIMQLILSVWALSLFDLPRQECCRNANPRPPSELTLSAEPVKNVWQYCRFKCPRGSRARNENWPRVGSQVAYEIRRSACDMYISWKEKHAEERLCHIRWLDIHHVGESVGKRSQDVVCQNTHQPRFIHPVFLHIIGVSFPHKIVDKNLSFMEISRDQWSFVKKNLRPEYFVPL